jgi:hypothetical protein
LRPIISNVPPTFLCSVVLLLLAASPVGACPCPLVKNDVNFIGRLVTLTAGQARFAVEQTIRGTLPKEC